LRYQVLGKKVNSENRPEKWKISRTGIQRIFKRTGTAISQFFKKNWNTGISYKEIWTHNQIPGSNSFLKRNSSKWVLERDQRFFIKSQEPPNTGSNSKPSVTSTATVTSPKEELNEQSYMRYITDEMTFPTAIQGQTYMPVS
jgi:hypothetical protein